MSSDLLLSDCRLSTCKQRFQTKEKKMFKPVKRTFLFFFIFKNIFILLINLNSAAKNFVAIRSELRLDCDHGCEFLEIICYHSSRFNLFKIEFLFDFSKGATLFAFFFKNNKKCFFYHKDIKNFFAVFQGFILQSKDFIRI